MQDTRSKAISVNNVCKTFSGHDVLRNCSLSITKESITGLIGPNGAGKSTLFNILAGALQADSGSVHYFDAAIEDMRPPVLFSHGILRTFQIPHEFSRLTVLENLMMVPAGQAGEHLIGSFFLRSKVVAQETKIRSRAREVLRMLNLDELRHNPAFALSGGQKKLLELGRTLMVDSPKLILLDEIAAGVNRSLLKILIDNIRNLNSNKRTTFFVIEHDMAMIEALCETVIVMAEGTIIDQGPFAKIRANPIVLDAYLGTNAKNEDQPIT